MPSHVEKRDTICALSTPNAPSAIGVIRLSGSQALEILARVFSVDETAPHRSIHLGTLRDTDGNPMDEVLVSIFRAPRSYTGDDLVEISAHGNPLLLAEILLLLQGLGARMAEPGEFTKRAYLSGKMDLTAAEAVNDLITAHSRYARDSALSRLGGGLSRKLEELYARLMGFLARVEVMVDHSDLPDVDTPYETLWAGLEALRVDVNRLLSSAKVGQITQNGLKVVLLGLPNSGKSSLMNALLREDRVIVSDIPGTTRDTIDAECLLRGVLVRILDTAGLRESVDVVEAMGIQRSKAASQTADLILYLVDATKGWTAQDQAYTEALPNKPKLFCFSKWDQATDPLPEGFIPLSVRTDESLAALEEAIEQFYRSFGFDPQTDAMLANTRQEGLLRQVVEQIERALTEIRFEQSPDIIAGILQNARHGFEGILGRSNADKVLDQVFSQFCIGK